MRRPIACVALALAALCAPIPAWAASAPGEPFGGIPFAWFGSRPSLGVDAHGAFVVVQQGNAEILVRRYSVGGYDIGSAVANTTTAGVQENAATAMAPDGRFVIVWTSAGQDGDGLGIYGQRYAADGSAAGAEFKVNTATPGDQRNAAIAMAADGSFVVAWESAGDASLRAQRYSADGSAAGSEIRLDEAAATGQEQFPALRTVAAGGFIVAWNDPATGITVRRYDSSGAAHAAAFQVAAAAGASTERIYRPALGIAGDGRFVVAWSNGTVSARLYDAAGAATTSAFTVNTDASKPAVDATAIMHGDGTFAIAWGRREANGTPIDVYLRRYDAAGQPLAPDQAVAAGQTASEPYLAIDADGDLTIAWTRLFESSPSVYARHYAGPEPVDLAVSVTHAAAGTTCDALSYTVTLTNQHAAGAPGVGTAAGVWFVLEHPEDMDYVAEDPSILEHWSCSRAETDATCGLKHGLVPGESRSVTLPFLAPHAPGTANVTATVTVGQVDPDTADNALMHPATFTQGAASGTLTLTPSTLSVPEGESRQITVTRSGGSNCNAYVEFESAAGTAFSPNDYPSVLSRLSWNDGQTGSRTLTFPTVEDMVDEDDETLGLSVTAVGASYGGPASVPVTIAEDDEAGLVVVVPSADPELHEGTGPVFYQVRLSSQPTAAVTLTITDDSERVSLSPTTIEFNAMNWQSLRTIQVTVVNDTLEQADESIDITHTFASTDEHYAGGMAIAQVTLIDDDGGHQTAGGGGGGGALGLELALIGFSARARRRRAQR